MGPNRLVVRSSADCKAAMSQKRISPFYQLPASERRDNARYLLTEATHLMQLWVYGPKDFRESVVEQLSKILQIDYGPFKVESCFMLKNA